MKTIGIMYTSACGCPRRRASDASDGLGVYTWGSKDASTVVLKFPLDKNGVAECH